MIGSPKSSAESEPRSNLSKAYASRLKGSTKGLNSPSSATLDAGRDGKRTLSNEKKSPATSTFKKGFDGTIASPRLTIEDVDEQSLKKGIGRR